MRSETWARRSYDRYKDGVMAVLADGGWHTGDSIESALLGPDSTRRDRLSVALCLDMLNMVYKVVERRDVTKADGCLADFEYRVREAEA